MITKTYFFLLILSLTTLSCRQSKSNQEAARVLKDITTTDMVSERIVNELLYDEEKIFFLSQIRNVPFDTLNFILRDYYVATDTISSLSKNSNYLYRSTIAKISDYYKIPKSKVASLIFSYKYEMLAKEDVLENMIEEAPESDNP